jgi:hypothetical protein
VPELWTLGSTTRTNFMSMEIHIFMEDSRVPSREAWQQAIEAAGFPAVLYQSLDLRKDTGFSPTAYNGQESGFELYLDPAASYLESYPHIAEQIGGRDRCVSFRWGGDLVEAAAAISSAAALTKLTDGIYFDPETDRVFTADVVLDGIQEDLSALS